MPHLRCPQLDILSNRLIEAYRHMTGTDISSIWSGGGAAVLTVAQLQAAMREHKISCILCKSIQKAGLTKPFPLPHSA
jgi:hypothetical protein